MRQYAERCITCFNGVWHIKDVRNVGDYGRVVIKIQQVDLDCSTARQLDVLRRQVEMEEGNCSHTCPMSSAVAVSTYSSFSSLSRAQTAASSPGHVTVISASTPLCTHLLLGLC